jgi:hypothetical protein
MNIKLLDREPLSVSKKGVAGSHPGSFYGLRKPRPSAPRCKKKKNEMIYGLRREKLGF